ncbi:hypothetical protein SUGI_0744940 [Cryptomeria japonica]|nr:hypothetical protein SUGI_0744940 [Cryptomeria japonica]
MGMIWKLSSFPQLCGVAGGMGNAYRACRLQQSDPLNNLEQRKHINVTRGCKMMENQEVSKDYRAGKIHAQRSVVDAFLQGNVNYNNSPQGGWNGKDTQTKVSKLDESTRMDENSGQVSKIKSEDSRKEAELITSFERQQKREGYSDRKSGIQFPRGGSGNSQNEMPLGEDGSQERASYVKSGTHDKQSSKGDYLDLARQSSIADMIARDSLADDGVSIESKLSEGEAELSDESLIINSDRELAFRKQAVKRSSVIAKQVISKTSALTMGFVSQLWVDANSWIVEMVEIRPSLFSGEMDKFFLKDLCQVGDVILVEDENVLQNELPMIGLDTLVGYSIITEDSYYLGKIRDYKFNINMGNVTYLEFDSFGVPFIPTSVVSTYCLLVEDVIEITSNTVVVSSGAAVRVQRLTKGLWESPNLHAKVWNDAKLRKKNLNIEDYGSMDEDFERQPNLLLKKKYSNKSRVKKAALKESDVKDEWQLPLDY